MINILNLINDKKDTLRKLLKDNNSKKILNEWLQLELAYTSNAIEGNTLTRKETAIVIDEKRTSSSKPLVYYQEAVNHAKAYSKIIEYVEQDLEINENEITNIHRYSDKKEVHFPIFLSFPAQYHPQKRLDYTSDPSPPPRQ